MNLFCLNKFNLFLLNSHIVVYMYLVSVILKKRLLIENSYSTIFAYKKFDIQKIRFYIQKFII